MGNVWCIGSVTAFIQSPASTVKFFLYLSGPAGGGSVDWVYGQLGVKYSYAVSMQDQSGRGERFVYVEKGLLEGVKAFVKAMQL